MRFIVLALLIHLSQMFAAKGQQVPFKSANWIGVDDEIKDNQSAQVFRKDFKVEGKEKKTAKLYITALGVYEAYLNGKRIGLDYFTPGFTVYNRRIQYQSYDIDGLLRNGVNTIEVLVSKGWYSGVFRNLTSDKASINFGNQIGLIAEIPNLLKTDQSWEFTDSKIKYSELYNGEFQDFNYETKGWKEVKVLEHYNGMLVLGTIVPVRKKEFFRPTVIFTTPRGEQVVDFGQNLAGWVQMKVRGKVGDTVRIGHAELLDQDGNFYTGNLRTARAEDVYVLKGDGLEILEPHFTYHGFRYARISGAKATTANCKAWALYSDLKATGSFSCSDPNLNQLHSNITWSMNSNFFDIPTDCPQRSERLGWTGDAQVFAGTASFLRDAKAFYAKWLEDVAVEQGANGSVPNFVPTSSPYRAQFDGVAGWGDAATILPWRLFEVYGDTALLERHYPMMRKWVDYVTSMSPGFLFQNNGYGDWYAIGQPTSIPYIDQCFYARSADIMVGAAKVLGKRADIAKYESLSGKIRSAFVGRYWNKGLAGTDTQTAYVLALEFGLLPDSLRPTAVSRLVELVRSNGNKLATGFLGTPYLLKALSDNGHSDLAYQLLLQKDCPSWLYPITKGATTIWERWDAIKPDGSIQATSFNHYAYGAVGQWMYENIAGISPLELGYKKVLIKPLIGGGLDWAKGRYLSGHGMISSHWKIRNGKLVLEVEIPKGVTAEVWVPREPGPRTIGPGKYKFKTQLK